MAHLTLGTVRARPPAEEIAREDWEAYTESQARFVNGVCFLTDSAGNEYEVQRPHAKDINVAGAQAVVFCWRASGEITVLYNLGHNGLARSEVARLCDAIDCQLHPVSDHFTWVERMIHALGDYAAELEIRSDGGVEVRLALLEGTTASEKLALHFVDPNSLNVLPLTRIAVGDIIKVTRSIHRVADL